MKVFLALSLLVALATAEPVGFRQQDRQQRQYYLAQVKEESADAPYPPSGFRPSGPAFNYPEKQNGASERQYLAPERQYGAPNAPQRQYGAPSAPQRQYGAPSVPQQQQYGAPSVPQQQYGAPSVPQQQYGAPSVPQQQYGAPQEATTTDLPNTTETEDATTVPTEFESEPVTSVNELDDEDSKGAAQQQQQQTGEYYIALPDGRLQRVSYVSRQDVEAMKYFAKIRAENVEPLRGPIFAYEPLQKLQVLPGGLSLAVGPASPVAPVAPVAPAASPAVPAKLEIEPVTQIQYRYDNPSEVISVGNAPLSYAGKYQLPAAESRYLLTFQ